MRDESDLEQTIKSDRLFNKYEIGLITSFFAIAGLELYHNILERIYYSMGYLLNN